MTEAEYKKIVKAFQQLGVEEEQIFNETLRAHQLDYGLFLDPGNSEYGVSQEDLYKSAKKTEGLFGAIAGDEAAYAAVYTLALGINPMAFAKGVEQAADDLHGMIREMIHRAESAGDTLLFCGADSYLSCMYEIFYKLPKKRIAAVVETAEWKDKLSFLLPRGRMMDESECAGDTEQYDFIFSMEEISLARLKALLGKLKDGGQLLALMPHDVLTRDDAEDDTLRKFIAGEGRLAEYYDGMIAGNEYALLSIGAPAEGNVSIGNMNASSEGVSFYELLSLARQEFANADDWSFEMYAFNGIPALASVLAHGLLPMDHTVGEWFEAACPKTVPSGTAITLLPAGAVSDSGIREDLLQDGTVTKDSLLLEMKRGDLVIMPSGPSMAVVSEKTLYGENWTLLRPKGNVTAEVLAMFLHGPFGKLLLETFRTKEGMRLIPSRLLRFPMPQLAEKNIEEITRAYDETTKALARAEADWRDAVRSAAETMMGE